VRSIRIIGVVKRVVAFSDMNQTRCASRQVYREALKVSERAIGQSSLVSSAQDHARRMVARHSSPSLSEMNASIAICTAVGPFAFVGVQQGLVRNVLADDLLNRRLIGKRNMERSDISAALDQSDDRTLVRRTALATLGERTPDCRLGANLGLIDGAVIGFVRLDDFAFATERAKAARAHRFADTVAHEPGRLVIELQGAVELVGAHALLAGVQEVEGHQPLVQRDMAALHDRAGGDREILAALLFGAPIPARLLERVGAANRAAMAANRPFRPAELFEPLAGVFGSLEVGRYKGVRNGRISSKPEKILAVGPCRLSSPSPLRPCISSYSYSWMIGARIFSNTHLA
jgi:hypothetical protein